MNSKISLRIMTIFFALFFMAGCVSVKTYKVEKARLDQAESGNRGFLTGEAKGSDIAKPKKATRTTYVTEVEFFSRKKKAPAGSVKETAKPIAEPSISQAPSASGDVAQKVFSQSTQQVERVEPVLYKVQPNETLQKISMKFYGTTKKWKKIYEANRGRLKSPDRIRAGQTLKIPQD